MHNTTISDSASRFHTLSQDALYTHTNDSRAPFGANSDAIAVKDIYGYYRDERLIGQNVGLYKTGLNWITVV